MRNTIEQYSATYDLTGAERYATSKIVYPKHPYFIIGPWGRDPRVNSFCDFWRHIIACRKAQVSNCYGTRHLFPSDHIPRLIRTIRFAEQRLKSYK